MIVRASTNQKYTNKPDLNYPAGTLVLVKSFFQDHNGNSSKVSHKRYMKVFQQYPYMIRCEDFNGNIECFTLGDAYCGIISKVKT